MTFTYAVLAALVAAISLDVDFTKEKGKVRRLNGVNGTARIGALNKPELDMLPAFAELEIPYTYLHDIPLANPGYMLVDVSRIFPLFHADADDPRNYDFAPTDFYIERIRKTGSDVIFRLGESIEHCGRPFRARSPADAEKWTRICLNIIRHYNEGWAEGHRWNITRWCVWEEPNGGGTFASNAPLEEYCRLYGTFAKAAKKAFPSLLVGGPTAGIPGHFDEWQESFLDYCRANDVPLDFFSFTLYTWSPTTFANLVSGLRSLLDRKGFAETRVVCMEWHLTPRNWNDMKGCRTPALAKAERETLRGPTAAAFAAGVLSHLQNAPIDEMCYYSATLGSWGMVDGLERLPTWYVFKAFSLMAAKGEAVRIDAPSSNGNETYLLASRHDGRGYVLVSAYGSIWPRHFTVAGAGRPVRVRVIDNLRNLEDLDAKQWSWNAKDRRVTLPLAPGCANSVWLVEFDLNNLSAEEPPESVEAPVRKEINGNG